MIFLSYVGRVVCATQLRCVRELEEDGACTEREGEHISRKKQGSVGPELHTLDNTESASTGSVPAAEQQQPRYQSKTVTPAAWALPWLCMITVGVSVCAPATGVSGITHGG